VLLDERHRPRPHDRLANLLSANAVYLLARR
jgi:hypothetical protein